MQLVRTRLLALTFCAALLAVGCKQNEGDPCDVTEDCAEGLTCYCGSLRDGVVVQRGQCLEVRPDVCLEPDAGRDLPEAGVEDAGTNDGAVPEDGGAEADAGPDGGLADAGTDAGPMDAGLDAGPMDAGADAAAGDAGPDAG